MHINEAARIESARIVEVDIPYAIPFQISGGISYSRKSLIIELKGEGITAYGEAAPFEAPFYSSETIASARAMLIEWLLPRVIGKEFNSIEHLNMTLREGIRGNNFALAGIETGYWDLIAKKNGLSLKELIRYKLEQLGTPEEFLASKDYILSGVSVGIPEDRSYQTLAQWIRNYVEEGYQRIKIKVKPGWDLEAMRVTREVIGPDFPFWVDANSSFAVDEHLDILKQMDAFNCLFLEQPLHHDDLFDHYKLSQEIKTPICFDESLKSLRIARQVLELGVSKIWNLKIQRVGGLLEAIKIYNLAVKNGVAVWGGTMPESGIGAMSILALASFAGFKYPADVEASSRWYGSGHDLIEITMDKEGRIGVPAGIGIGEINRENYHRYGRVVYEVGLKTRMAAD
ncbi:o-succinylbenzoate synthase [Neomoorella glycerini]|uniref:o-succinylbenzoate synthase n=1 Tax=Neomoorella glycerini TaxID=55779 RepID=A0A6I5ZQG8_9FIRM|nr:o-succinylbenzoate synthase [Moorella glycerini]QGP92038.1 o-succinylbenzoate synthase [Moorella glycerini]